LLHCYRILGHKVCDELYQVLACESAKTYRHIRQAIKPAQEPPFNVTALQIARSDQKGSVDTILTQEDFDSQEWWCPVRKASNDKQSEFVQAFGTSVVKIFGEALPHRSIRVRGSKLRVPQINIPNGLFSSKAVLLAQLKGKHLIDPTLSDDTSYLWLRKFFPHVCIQKWTPFSKCDVCSRIKQLLFGAASEEDRQRLLRELAAHRASVTLSRQRLAVRSHIAQAHPSCALFLIADGMDSAKTFSPHVITHFLASKGLSERGRHLKTKIMGVLAEGSAFYGFIIYPHYSGGPNILCSSLHITLLKHAHNGGGLLPPVLFLQLDNCGGDNKNHTVFAYLAYLVQIGVFHTIYVDFLIVGKCGSFMTKPGIGAESL
jgi:hypothetical protein